MPEERFLTEDQNDILPPPVERYVVLRWLKRNLFGGIGDILLTLLCVAFLFVVIRAILKWVIYEAKWRVIVVNLRLLMVGQYPLEQGWRIWVCLVLLALIVGITWGVWTRSRWWESLVVFGFPLIFVILPFASQTRLWWAVFWLAQVTGWGIGRAFKRILHRLLIAFWVLYFPIAIVLIRGLGPENQVLPMVPSRLWGGLLLTFMLAIIGIIFSFPLGILLAIGRQSTFPVVRSFCIIYIELIRALPLITVLFMAQVMLPLFLSDNITVDRVLRAMVAITLFSAAYMAENVRGGLQSISKGQYEAANALGLNRYQTMRLIVLPQALRAVIPVLVSHCIGLFRDTSLVIIVGLLDLLGISKTVVSQPDFLGSHIEVYTFLAALYWLFSYVMSHAGQRIETGLGVNQQQ